MVRRFKRYLHRQALISLWEKELSDEITDAQFQMMEDMERAYEHEYHDD